MGNLLIRRPLLATAGDGGGTPTPIYTLSEAVSSNSYDTGVKLFNEEKSFTILCEAYVNIYNWANAASIFGIDTGTAFKVGRIQSGTPMTANVSGTASSYYCGLIFNGDGDMVTNKGRSLYARGSSGKYTRRFAVRYNHTNRRVEGNSPNILAPGTAWWYLNNALVSDTTLKLNISTSTNCTVNHLFVYDAVLSDAVVNDFLENGVS